VSFTLTRFPSACYPAECRSRRELTDVRSDFPFSCLRSLVFSWSFAPCFSPLSGPRSWVCVCRYCDRRVRFTRIYRRRPRVSPILVCFDGPSLASHLSHPCRFLAFASFPCLLRSMTLSSHPHPTTGKYLVGQDQTILSPALPVIASKFNSL
jgi:hypothetical protein